MRTGTAYWGYTHPSKPSAILLGVRVYFSHSSARTFLQAWGLKNMASLCHPLLFPFSSLSPAFTSFQTSELCWLVFNEVFFHRLVVLSLTIKNSQLLEAENKIWPEVNWECNLIIGVDIFKSLCLKKKKALGERGDLSRNEYLFEYFRVRTSIFSWKQDAFLLFRESCGYFDAFSKCHN